MKKMKPITIVLSVILFIAFILIFMYAGFQPGALLSCEQGKFIEFISIGTPMKVVNFPGACSGKILIKTENGEKVCETEDYNSEEDKVVRIRCNDLRYYKNRNLTVQYQTFSVQYGNQSGVVTAFYP